MHIPMCVCTVHDIMNTGNFCTSISKALYSPELTTVFRTYSSLPQSSVMLRNKVPGGVTMPTVVSNKAKTTGGVATIQQEYAKHRGPQDQCPPPKKKITTHYLGKVEGIRHECASAFLTILFKQKLCCMQTNMDCHEQRVG